MRLLLFFTISFFSLITLAQQAAQFEVTFYFEDIFGNKDSVTVGNDSLASSAIESVFGEEEILTPFDSILEVRAGSSEIPYQEKLSKRIFESNQRHLGQWFDSGCYAGRAIWIYVWAKHWPLKMSWNSSIFLDNICNRGSILSDHREDELAGPIDLDSFPQNFYCLAVEDTISVELTEEAFMANPGNARISVEKEVEGLGIQTIYALRFGQQATFGWTPCYWVTNVEEALAQAETLSIYPNPGREEVNLQLPEHIQLNRLRLFDLGGKLVRLDTSVSNNRLDVSMLSSGIYQVVAEGSDKKLYLGKFVKIE